MGSPSPATSTTTNVTKLPQFIEDGGADNYALAKTAANNLAPAYQGNMVAGQNSTQQQAYDMATSGATIAQPAMQQSMSTLNGEQAYNPQQVQGASWLNANQAAYMNPYTQNVVDTTNHAANNARLQALNQTGAQAVSAGAFGGSRHGVMEGVTNAQSLQNMAAQDAQLYSSGYTNAQQAFNSDADRQLTADRSNQTTGLAASQARTQAAMDNAQTGALAQNSWLQGASGVQAVGDAQRSYQQDLLNQQAQQYDAVRNYPLEQLGIRTSALSLTPYGTSSTSSTTSQGGGGNLAGSLIGAGGSIGAALIGLSDANLKKDKVPLGVTDPQTGADIYSYRYNNDAPNAPKTVGPMAQDLQAQGLPTANVGGAKVARMGDLVTPTVADIAARTGMRTAKSLLGGGGGPGLLSDAPMPKMNAPMKGKKR